MPPKSPQMLKFLISSNMRIRHTYKALFGCLMDDNDQDKQASRSNHEHSYLASISSSLTYRECIQRTWHQYQGLCFWCMYNKATSKCHAATTFHTTMTFRATTGLSWTASSNSTANNTTISLTSWRNTRSAMVSLKKHRLRNQELPYGSHIDLISSD